MMKRRNGASIVSLLGLLVLSATVPAVAHAFPGGGPGFGPHPPGPGSVLDRLIFPCPGDCEDTANTCTSAAG